MKLIELLQESQKPGLIVADEELVRDVLNMYGYDLNDRITNLSYFSMFIQVATYPGNYEILLKLLPMICYVKIDIYNGVTVNTPDLESLLDLFFHITDEEARDDLIKTYTDVNDALPYMVDYCKHNKELIPNINEFKEIMEEQLIPKLKNKKYVVYVEQTDSFKQRGFTVVFVKGTQVA